MLDPNVTEFIDNVKQPWQVEVCGRLRDMVHAAVPDVAERIQYRKPHFLKDGKYAAVISPAKDYVAFMIFNAEGIEGPAGLFEAGPPERKTTRIREGQEADYELLGRLLAQAADSL